MLRRRGAEVALAAVLALVEGEVEPRAQSGFGGREPGSIVACRRGPGVVADGFLVAARWAVRGGRTPRSPRAISSSKLEPIAERARAIRCSTPARRSSLSTRSITARPSYHDQRAATRPQIATFAPGPAPGTG